MTNRTTKTMPDYFFSVDPGNGLVNAYKATAAGTITSDSFPSARAEYKAGSVGLAEFEQNAEVITINGTPYVFGDEVFISARNTSRHQGAERYGNEAWRTLVLAAIARLKVKSGAVIDLVTFAPPSLLERAKAAIIEHMADTTHIVQTSNRKTELEFTIRNVTVLPEGAAALLAFALDSSGSMQSADALAGKNVILDMGMYTFDDMTVTNGKLNVQDIEHATRENSGIREYILRPTLSDVKRVGNADFSLMTVDHIDQALRQGLQSTYTDASGQTRADYRLNSGAGTSMNIENFLVAHGETYATWIADNVIDGQLSGLRGYKSAILVGGGTPLVWEFLNRWYPGKLLDTETIGIAPVDMNAAAGIRYALYKAYANLNV